MNIEEISHLSDKNQAEKIADHFTSITNQFDEITRDDISMPSFSPEDVPQFGPGRVWLLLAGIKTNKATIPGDFPPKLIKMFAAYP